MPFCVRIALAAAALACIVLTGPVAAGSTPAQAAAKKRCKVVKRIVHGKKKRVRICRRGKPKPAPIGPWTKPTPTQPRPIALGTPAQVDEGWRVAVLSVDPNRTQQILDAQSGDPDNLPEPLPDGYQFLLARVTVTRTGEDPAAFSPYSLALAAAGTSYGDDCGTLLDGLTTDELAPGQSATGDVCWKIASTQVAKALMTYTDPFTGRVTYFSLL